MRRLAPLLGVFLLALLLRGLHWWGQSEANPLFLAPNMDELKHHEWALRLASGEGLGQRPFFRAPLYYVALAALYKAAGPSIPLARALGCLVGSATVVLITVLGTRLSGARAGLAAGLLAACYWPFIHGDQLLLSAVLESFLGVALLLLLLAATERDSWKLWAAAGLAFGLSAITRPTILTFAPVLVLAALRGGRLLRPAGAPPSRPGRAWVHLLVVAGAAAMAIAPVTLYNRLVGGEWVLVATNGGLNFSIGNNPRADGVSAAVPGTRTDWDGGYEDTHAVAQREWGPKLGRPLTESEVSDYWYGKAWSWIRSAPREALQLAFRKLARFWAPVEIPNNNAVWFFARMSPLSPLYVVGFPVVAILGMAGLALLPRAAWRAWWLPVSFGLIGMLTVVAFFVVDRYRMPFVPVLMLSAGAGLARIPDAWRAGERLGLARWLLVAAAVAGLELLCRPGAPLWPEGRHFGAQETAQGERVLGDHSLRLAVTEPALLGAALRHYEEAARALPMSPDVQFALGYARMRSTDPLAEDRAGGSLEMAIRMRPTFADARRYYAEWLVRQGRLGEAVPQYRSAIRQQPWGDSYLASLIGLGIVLLELRQPEEAGPLLLDALRIDPTNAFAVEGLIQAAQGLRERGRSAASADLLKRGLNVAPTQRPIVQALRGFAPPTAPRH